MKTWTRERDHGPGLGRDVALIVVLKVLLVGALYLFLFRLAPRPAQDPAAAAAGATAGPLHEEQR